VWCLGGYASHRTIKRGKRAKGSDGPSPGKKDAPPSKGRAIKQTMRGREGVKKSCNRKGARRGRLEMAGGKLARSTPSYFLVKPIRGKDF